MGVFKKIDRYVERNSEGRLISKAIQMCFIAVLIYSVYNIAFYTPVDMNNTEFVNTNVYSSDYSHTITLHNNLSAVDPTYDQVIEFVKNDKTDTNTYILGKFTCVDYASIVQKNAEKAV